MTIQLSERLERALQAHAAARGTTPDGYVSDLLTRELKDSAQAGGPVVPFETSYGLLKKYGPAPTEEEIDANRADMLRGFGESF